MKMQIWKIWITEGMMGAVHGHFFPIFEGYVPDLKLTINYVSSFVIKDELRYKAKNEEQKEAFEEQKDPELICEVEMSRVQIEDAKILTQEMSPQHRLMKLVSESLAERSLDNSAYEKTLSEEEDDWADECNIDDR